MEYETWAMGDGNSVLYTEDYAAYRKALSVKGVEWFGTYSTHDRDYAWQVIFPTRLKGALRKRIVQNATQKGVASRGLSKRPIMNMGSKQGG